MQALGQELGMLREAEPDSPDGAYRLEEETDATEISKRTINIQF